MKIIPFLLALGLAVGGVVAPSVTATPDEGAITVVASPAFAGMLRPGQSLLVSGTMTNSASQTLDAGIASVYVGPSKMVTRAAVDRWLSDDSASTGPIAGNALGEVQIGELAAGQAKPFTISVSPALLTFMSGDTGVFPLEVRLASGEVTLASQRSAVSWYPESQVPRVNLAVVMPISAPASTSGLLDAETLSELTSVGGDLYQALDTALAHTVAIGVDPMIVASIRLLGEGAPQAAQEWLLRLELTTNDIFALNYADTDQLLWRQAGVTSPLKPLSFPEQDNVIPSPVNTPDTSTPASAPGVHAPSISEGVSAFRTTIDNLAWPSQDRVSEKDLDFLSSGGSTRTLVPSSEIAGSGLLTPNVLVGEHRVTVTDDAVSKYLLAASTARTESAWAQVAASLTATLTATATQNSSATLVATIGRSSAPNSRMLVSTLNALESLPWVNPIALSSALRAAAVNGSISAAPSAESTQISKDRVPLAMELLDSEATLTEFSSVADDPTLVTGPQRLSLLALLSATWADDPPGWKEAVQQHLSDDEVLLSAVHIPESSSITFPLEKGDLPIAVRNELDFPVTVFVTVRPERAIINVLDDRVELKIEANSQAKVFVPVESIANGEVHATVTLSSATGITISRPAFVLLNVQAGWETTATVVLAVIVIALFGAGIWREVRRRRKPKLASELEPEPETDLQPELQPGPETRADSESAEQEES